MSMMNHLLFNIQLCEKEEYARAAKQHGLTFRSLHEGYAVMLEEAEEASNEVGNLDRCMAALWQATRNDDLMTAQEAASRIRQTAHLLAAEAVQTAAMANKLLNSIELAARATGKEPPKKNRRTDRYKNRQSS